MNFYEKTPLIVFALGGVGKRFADAGYTGPKYMLPYRGLTIIESILNNLKSENAAILTIINVKDKDFAEKLDLFVKSRFKHHYIVEVENTKGQAETVKIGLERSHKWITETINPGSMFILNGDTITEEKDIDSLDKFIRLNNFSGLIEFFKSNDPGFSYVITDENSILLDIAEKKLISCNATTGFYAFKSIHFYLSICSELNPSSDSELYVSNVYKSSLNRPEAINICIESVTAPIILGTPHEYESSIKI